MIDDTILMVNLLDIFEKDIYINKNFKHIYNYYKDISTLKTIIRNEFKYTKYYSLLRTFLDTFNSVYYRRSGKEILKTREEFQKEFIFMINTYILKYNSELPIEFKYNQVGNIIEKYLNTKCEICKKYGYYRGLYDETLGLNIPLCFDCAAYKKCKLCEKKCLLYLDCIRCKKLYCMPCSLYKTRVNNCYECSTCSICIDVFRECGCVHESST